MDAKNLSTDRALIGPLAFAVSPDERARLRTVSTIRGSSERTRAIAVVNGIVVIANGMLQTLLGSGMLEPRTALTPVHLTIGIVCLVVGPLCLFGMVSDQPIFSRSRLQGEGERRFAMYDGGLTFDRPASLVPWSRVRSIVDVGDAFVVRTTLRRRYLPKRIFEDGGDAFWAYAASRIVSSGRMLVVPTHRRTLRNSVHP